MINVRRAAERGRTQIDWLDSRHTFSFGEYYDPTHMGFRALRVINEDRVAPGAGFATHGHRDMEIVTYVLDGRARAQGQPRHRLGDPARRRAAHERRHRHPAQRVQPLGQRAGAFPADLDHPRAKDDLAPGYEQKSFDRKPGELRLVGSRDGRDGSITIHQDADLYAGDASPRRHGRARPRGRPSQLGAGRARRGHAQRDGAAARRRRRHQRREDADGRGERERGDRAVRSRLIRRAGGRSSLS